MGGRAGGESEAQAKGCGVMGKAGDVVRTLGRGIRAVLEGLCVCERVESKGGGFAGYVGTPDGGIELIAYVGPTRVSAFVDGVSLRRAAKGGWEALVVNAVEAAVQSLLNEVERIAGPPYCGPVNVDGDGRDVA